MIDALTTLAVRHGTDKFGLHDYTPRYHALFAPFRDRPVRILEIGVGGYADEDRGGQSLATWRDYFPLGEVTGLDIQRKTIPLGERVRIYQGSQVDADFLARVVEERGPFDLIVDDGSHRNEHVVESLRLLFPGLAPGGIYVVEDVQTSFMPRFGGSLTLDAPNSVGHAIGLIDAVGGDIAAIERFHNMIALRKAGGTATGSETSRSWATAGATARVTGDASEATLREAFAALPEPGVLAVEGHPGPEIAALLRHLFIQVDHREIAVNFPAAPVDPMARQLGALEIHPDGAIIVKAPNDYPSNFAFDADHPEARAAMAAIEAALEGCEEENGLVQYANLVTLTRGREAAGPWIDRMIALGATSRTFYQLAGGLAQRQRRFADAEGLFAEGVARYPDDPTLVQGLASMLLIRGDAAAARDCVAAALALTPRSVGLHLLMVRVAERLEDHDLGIAHATQATAMSGGARRPPALTTLGEALARAGRWTEAAVALTEAVASPNRLAGRAWRALSAARAAMNDPAGAIEAADKALALSPATGEYRAWRARLAA